MKAKQTILEAVVFVVVACVVGLTVNAQRSDGLQISRDYFPPLNSAGPPAQRVQPPAPRGNGPVQPDGQVPDHDFQTVSLESAYDYYQRGESSIVFIDARDDAHFEKCHIPNAVQFDYYHPDRYIDEVRDFAADADVVIVYCNGGACEDSLQTARYLTEEIDNPLAFETVYVFEGGIEAWYKAGYEREPENCKP